MAAKIQGIPAYIVVPKGAPKCKVDNVIRYGGKVIWSEATMSSREEIASKVLQETGSVLIHPYNDGRIIRYFAFSILVFQNVSVLLWDNFFCHKCVIGETV